MSQVQEIPQPHILDPQRMLRKHGSNFTEDERPEPELLAKGLEESCGYGRQLWDTLNAVRQYLLDSLPPDPRSPNAAPITCASPTGPDDEVGWSRWIDTYSAATSVLCGPHGDSGFGLSRARHEAQARRTAPVVRLRTRAPQTSPDEPGQRSAPSIVSKAHVALTVALGLLALRGLRRS